MSHSQLQRLACGLGMLLLIAGMQPGDWSTSDKTNVDLESAPAVTAGGHAHPRGARHYRYDESEVDLATPLPESRQAAPDSVPADAPEAVSTQEEEAPQ